MTKEEYIKMTAKNRMDKPYGRNMLYHFQRAYDMFIMKYNQKERFL